MKTHGTQGAKKHFYMRMQGIPSEIDTNCRLFLNAALEIGSYLDSIPSKPSNKKFVVDWLEEYLKEFDKRKGNNWDVFSLAVWKEKYNGIANN